MAEKEEKQGFLSRLFGRKADPVAQPAPQESESDKIEPVVETVAVEEVPALGADVVSAPDADAAPEPVEAAPDAPVVPELSDPVIETIAVEDVSAPGVDVAPTIIDEPSVGQEPAPVAEEALVVSETLAAAEEPVKKLSWWQRLTSGLFRTSSSIGERLNALFTKRKLDAATIEDLEDILVQADLGVEAAMRITERLSDGRFDKEIAPDDVKAVLAEEVEKSLTAVAKPLEVDTTKKPFVILMVGVNGSGKTTTIGKLAAKFKAQGLKVMLAAGDTFRAAAIEQLKVWGERNGVPVVATSQGADAAGLAFDALQKAKETGIDVLMVDTAGRLQNKTGLMDELEKIIRVMKKVDPEAPHASLLVLDATVGQNALSQVELFGKTAGITGLIMTKLDGTARGGILVAVADKFSVPVHFIGVGEGVDDLEPFAARDFARAIAGLDGA